MTGKTHRVGGVLSCLGGYILLKENGMLLGDVDPLLQLTVMYPFAIYGSVVSDLDHAWESSPCRDIVSYVINKILHLTTPINEGKTGVLSLLDARHRSWQTHSDLFLFLMMFVSSVLLNQSVNNADHIIIRLIFMGLVLGISSHLVLDMLTPEGIWFISLVFVKKLFGLKFLPSKVSFVPNTEFFRTGGSWEKLIRWLMWLICLFFLFKIILWVSSYSIDFLKA